MKYFLYYLIITSSILVYQQQIFAQKSGDSTYDNTAHTNGTYLGSLKSPDNSSLPIAIKFDKRGPEDPLTATFLDLTPTGGPLKVLFEFPLIPVTGYISASSINGSSDANLIFDIEIKITKGGNRFTGIIIEKDSESGTTTELELNARHSLNFELMQGSGPPEMSNSYKNEWKLPHYGAYYGTWAAPHYGYWSKPYYGYWSRPYYGYWNKPYYGYWSRPYYGYWNKPYYGYWSRPYYGYWNKPYYGYSTNYSSHTSKMAENKIPGNKFLFRKINSAFNK